jgi:hypothetical protein
MGWDSNPRGAETPASFQDWCLQPLGHPSPQGHGLQTCAVLGKAGACEPVLAMGGPFRGLPVQADIRLARGAAVVAQDGNVALRQPEVQELVVIDGA